MATVSVINAERPVVSGAGWLAFQWSAPLPSAKTLGRVTERAGDAALLALRPGLRRRRVVDLDHDPDALDLAETTLVFRGDLVREFGLRPDPDLDPGLSALLLAARYLAAVPHPTVATARLRGAAHLPPDLSDPNRYALAPQRFAELFEQVDAERGSVPPWLQRIWLRQMFGYLREDRRLARPSAALGANDLDAFHRAFSSALRHIDENEIVGYPGADGTDEARAALLIGARQRHGHTRPARRHDHERALSRVSYFFAGVPPTESVTLDGVPLRPEHQKVRTVQIVGRPLLTERILWVPPAATVAVDTAGEVALDVGVRREGTGARYRRILRENRGVARSLARDMWIRRRAHSRRARLRYRAAWLLMDRDSAARDNAEHLYRYLRTAEPGVNAWFVLARDSPDWERLAGEGFRLIGYGSTQYFVALLHCAHLVSSQVDDYVCHPLRKHALGPPGWRFTFLQHGVMLHDLSRWLNHKPIDCFVTSTPVEQQAIVADHTEYVFTDLETRMLGLARHDRLLRLARASRPRVLLVMPTWRPRLLGDRQWGNSRQLLGGIWESGYGQAWRELLESESLQALCERQDWQLCFVPHPNMEAMLDLAELPEHVRTHHFSRVDVQALIADAAVLVTDYSSLASEAAYAGRPVVYYQFDRDEFFGGTGFRRLGRWSYERDGFGPVTRTVLEAVAAVGRIARHGGPEPTYADRIERGFPLRDGRCCERTVSAIRAITAP